MQQSESHIALRRTRGADDSRKMLWVNGCWIFTTPMSWLLLIVSTLASLLVATAGARADAVAQREDEFKAAYVFNFVKFVEWPPEAASDTLTICFVGGAGVYEALTTDIENKRAGARRVAAVQLVDAPPAGTCNALYVDAAMAATYTPTDEAAVLTISDAAAFAVNGGMIELFTENHRLRFSINVNSAQRAGLRISSDLLKLAAGVQRGRR